MDDDLLIRWLTLVHTKGLGPSLLRKLMDGLGSVDAILGCSDSKLQQHGLQQKIISALRSVDETRIRKDLDWAAEASDRCILTQDSPQYPRLLLEIADPPLVLYVRGDAEVLSTPQVAIVGSRKPSHSAENHAFKLASELTGYGITVTSGLAHGVDGCAHRGALASGGYTVAVPATGLDRVYPAAHQQLAQEIAQHSVIVSEFPIGTNPLPGHFPRRNRVISGLCYGTLVVEATLKSGTLTTAAHATSQSREIFAIPGNIDNPQSRGCHSLLRNGATLVETIEDIIEPLAPLLPRSVDFAPKAELPDYGNRESQKQSSPDVESVKQKTEKRESATSEPISANPAQTGSKETRSKEAKSAADGKFDASSSTPLRSTLLETLGSDPMSLDDLLETTGIDIASLTKITLDLELEGKIRQIPGGNFVREIQLNTENN